MKGKFITVEGTEGVGKSTNMAFIASQLKAAGIDVVQTREPGGTPLAEELRELLLSNREENFDSTAELLVVFAARAQHLNQVILPAIEKGQWILCDRFTDATYAYQGFGRGLSLDNIEQLENLVQGSVRPDMTFLLDIDVKQGLARAAERAELDRFENERIDFFEKVRAGYLKRATQHPQRYSVIDAGQALDAVQRDIADAVGELLQSV